MCSCLLQWRVLWRVWSPGIKASEFNYHLAEGAPLTVGTWSRASVCRIPTWIRRDCKRSGTYVRYVYSGRLYMIQI